MLELAIETTGLNKSFGKTVAVDGIDLSIARGGVHAVLGPNGAGKTTTIRMLSTLMRPDSGTARVLGRDILTDATEVRRRVSLTGQFASVDEDLTGSENLRLIGRLFGYPGTRARQRASELLEAFNLSEAADRQVKKYSGGMRRRLDIAASITVTPASSSSTNRPPVSTRAAAVRCGTSSGRWWRAEQRCCSRPSTWKKPINSPTESASSTTAKSSGKERAPN